jgi:hypothetical protein
MDSNQSKGEKSGQQCALYPHKIVAVREVFSPARGYTISQEETCYEGYSVVHAVKAFWGAHENGSKTVWHYVNGSLVAYLGELPACIFVSVAYLCGEKGLSRVPWDGWQES